MRHLRATRFEISSLDVGSLARLLAATGGMWALITATLGAALADIFSQAPPDTLRAAALDIALYLVGAYVVGTVYGAVYNLGARHGGLELDLLAVRSGEDVLAPQAEKAAARPVGRWARARVRTARRRERLVVLAWVAPPLCALAWFLMMLPVHSAEHQALAALEEIDQAGSGDEVKAACLRCLDATSRCRVISLLYPKQRASLNNARARATVRLAEACYADGRMLAAALLATDYLEMAPAGSQRALANSLAAYAHTRGVTATQMAAARSLQARPQRLTWRITPTGEKLQGLQMSATCAFRCRGPMALAPSRHLVEAPRWGAKQVLEIGPLRPGQQLQAFVEWEDLQAPKGVTVSLADFMVFPLHVAPAEQAR